MDLLKDVAARLRILGMRFVSGFLLIVCAGAFVMPGRAAPSEVFHFDFVVSEGWGESTGGEFTVKGTIGSPDGDVVNGENFEIKREYQMWAGRFEKDGVPTFRLQLLANGFVEVSWPAGWSGFVLQERSNCSEGEWTELNPTPSYDPDFQRVLVAPGAQRSAFYRLFRQ